MENDSISKIEIDCNKNKDTNIDFFNFCQNVLNDWNIFKLNDPRKQQFHDDLTNIGDLSKKPHELGVNWTQVNNNDRKGNGKILGYDIFVSMKQFIFSQLYLSIEKSQFRNVEKLLLFNKNVNNYSLGQILIDLIETLVLGETLHHWNRHNNEDTDYNFVFDFNTVEETDLYEMIFGNANGKIAAKYVLQFETIETPRQSISQISSSLTTTTNDNNSVIIHSDHSGHYSSSSIGVVSLSGSDDSDDTDDELKQDLLSCQDITSTRIATPGAHFVPATITPSNTTT